MNTPEQYFRDLAIHLENKAEFWRTKQDDSHGINTAVYVSLKEMADAVRHTQNDPSPPTPVEPRSE